MFKEKHIAFKERRKSSRRLVNRVAQYYTELGQLPRTCMVTNMSDSGARLYSESDMPPQFILSLSGDGVNVRHECRVVWRLGGEIGVEFVRGAR